MEDCALSLGLIRSVLRKMSNDIFERKVDYFSSDVARKLNACERGLLIIDMLRVGFTLEGAIGNLGDGEYDKICSELVIGKMR